MQETDVNALLKQFREMKKMMQQLGMMGKGGGKGRGGFPGLGALGNLGKMGDLEALMGGGACRRCRARRPPRRASRAGCRPRRRRPT